MNFSRINWSRCRFKFILSSSSSNYDHQRLFCRVCHTVAFRHRSCFGSVLGPQRKRYSILNNKLEDVWNLQLARLRPSSSKATGYQDGRRVSRPLSTIPSQKVEDAWNSQSTKGAQDRSPTPTAHSQNLSPEEGGGDKRNNESTDAEVGLPSYAIEQKEARTSGSEEKKVIIDLSANRSGESTPGQSMYASMMRTDSESPHNASNMGLELSLNMPVGERPDVGVATGNAAESTPGSSHSSGILMKESKYARDQEQVGEEGLSKDLLSGVEKALKGGKDKGHSRLTYKDVEAKGKQKGSTGGHGTPDPLHSESSKQDLLKRTTKQEVVNAETGTKKSTNAEPKLRKSGSKKTRQAKGKEVIGEQPGATPHKSDSNAPEKAATKRKGKRTKKEEELVSHKSDLNAPEKAATKRKGKRTKKKEKEEELVSSEQEAKTPLVDDSVVTQKKGKAAKSKREKKEPKPERKPSGQLPLGTQQARHGTETSVAAKKTGGKETERRKEALVSSKQKEEPKKKKKNPPRHDPDYFFNPVLDLCVSTERMDIAQSFFDSCTSKGSPRDLRFYNLMLTGWAKRGDIDAVKKVFAMMSRIDVQPNAQSFASVLECIGRMEPVDSILAGYCISELEEDGMTLADLVTSTKFTQDSREVVLGVIRSVRPEFEVPPPPERPACSLNVVKKLYQDRLPSEGAMAPLADLFNPGALMEKMDLQWETEKKENITIKSVEEETHPSQQVLDKRKALTEHKDMWRQALKKGLVLQKKKMKAKSFKPLTEFIYPFMTILDDDDYVQMMMDALPKFAATSEGIGTLNLARDLGSRLNQRYIICKKRKSLVAEKMKKIYQDYMQQLMESDQQSHSTHRELWQHLLDENPEGPSLDFETHAWPSTVVLKVGNFLSDIMLREIQIDAHSKTEKKFIPGLYHMYTYRSMKQVGFIKPHPLLIDLFQGAKDPDLPFDSNILPMVTPPLPWMSARFGGYPLSATSLMRCKEGSIQAQLVSDKADTPDLHPVLDSLNQLSSVPWVVNKKMLDIIIDIFRKEGSKELGIPQPPSAFPPLPPMKSDATPEEISQIHQERASMRKTQAEMHSLRMDMLYKLSIANHFRDEIFWFPHNMDFRGRVYPCPPHFNHLGSDVTRSLLLFAQGRPLGEKGLDWLKIHLVNLSGHKKRVSLEDRLAYANEILPDVLDSAERPFDGKKWWQSADVPLQALACCMEINNAIKSADPTQYVSHLPIHQDGSCNGLQHYAALCRDVIGAEQVNLHPSPVPQDVYSGVAQMVEGLRQKDADNGLKVAKALEGLVQRKVVKQTVMTVVYGVTAFGGRHQIFRQLKDMEIMSEDDAWYAAKYLVHNVFRSLGKMFAKTREIQDWLTESALMIAKGGSSVEWVTPLGLPIVQPYHKKYQVWVGATEKWSLFHNESAKGQPLTIKQKNAFPPNFIHSLDSTHMMLTSLHCQQAGVTFASVHDCFWTHACSVDVMNKICREQFVSLHEQPILHDLSKYLIDKFGDREIDPRTRTTTKASVASERNYVRHYLRKVPETGDFDLRNVLQSTYFFS